MLIEPEILNSIFEIGPNNNVQSRKAIARCIELVKTFGQGLDVFVENFNISESELGCDVKTVHSIIGTFDKNILQWMPQYGCAVGYHRQNEYDYELYVYGLDNWDFVINESNKGYAHTSFSRGSKKVSLNRIEDDFDTLEKIIDTLKVEIEKQENKEKKKHKTPSFIVNLLNTAILTELKHEEMYGSENMRGGFTDVGMHTDVSFRDTNWALVREVLRFNFKHEFSPTELVFERIMIVFKLWLFENSCTTLSETHCSYSIKHEERLYQMLKLIFFESNCYLSENKLPSKHVVRITNTCYQTEELWRKKKLKEFNCNFDFGISKSNSNCLSDVEISCDWKEITAMFGNSIENWRLAAIGELNCIVAPSIYTINPRLFFLELQTLSKSSTLSVNSLLLMRFTKQHVWHLFQAVLENKEAQLSIDDVKYLDKIIDLYENNFNTYLSSIECKEYSAPSRTVVCSNKVLVVWAAFCLIHDFNCKQHQLIRKFDVPIDPNDLGHLVLSSKLDYQILKSIGDYINGFFKHNKKNRIFYLNDPSGTWRLAQCYCNDSEKIQEIFLEEEKLYKIAEEKQWQEVKEIKENIKVLEKELERKECQLHNLKYYEYQERRNVNSEIQQICNSIESLDQKVPPTLIKALPEYNPAKQNVSFFAFMPRSLRYLSKYSVLSQQCLGEKSEIQFESTLNYHNHIQSYALSSLCKEELITEVDIGILSVTKGNPNQWDFGPRLIKQFNRRGSKTWAPDYHFKENIFWFGKSWGCSYFPGNHLNPFMISSKDTALSFTAKLKQEDSILEKYLYLNALEKEKDLARGNVSYASQLPQCFTLKKQFHWFAKLRENEMLQISNISSILIGKHIPFHLEVLHVILRQCMYHVGKLEFNPNAYSAWRKILLDSKKLKLIGEKLQQLVTEVDSEEKGFQLFAEMVSFFSQYEPDSDIGYVLVDTLLEEIEKKALIKEEMARELQQENKNNSEHIRKIRGMEAMLYGYGLKALEFVSLENKKRATKFCKLMVKFRNRFKYCADDPWLIGLNKSVEKIGISRVQEINKVLSETEYDCLEEVLNCVYDIKLGNKKLHWTPLQITKTGTTEKYDVLGVYECYIESEKLAFHISVITGELLVNGQVLNFLPNSIQSHKHYRSVFGERNFEVVINNSKYESTMAESGFRYRFSTCNDGSLFVEEINEREKQTLHLLDKPTLTNWGKNLPERIRNSYSFWKTTDGSSAIFTRAHQYSIRILEYVGIIDKEFSDLSDLFLYKIPKRKKMVKYAEILDEIMEQHSILKGGGHSESELPLLFPLLKIGRNSATKCFSKFEKQQFIEIYQTHFGEFFLYDLYRYKLKFEGQNLEIFSKNWLNFQVSKKQYIKNTWNNFSQYLILEKEDQNKIEKMIIIPNGIFSIIYTGGKEKIEISIKDDYETKLEYFEYEVDQRFSNIKGRSVLSRLHLAALYTATSNNWNSNYNPLMQTSKEKIKNNNFEYLVPGYQQAIHLVRQSFNIRDTIFDKAMEKLQNIYDLSSHSVELRVLCDLVFNQRTAIMCLSSKYNQNNGDEDSEKRIPVLKKHVSLLGFYKQQFLKYGIFHRSLLNKHESELLGPVVKELPQKFSQTVELESVPISEKELDSLENSFLPSEKQVPKKKNEIFPLKNRNPNKLTDELYYDLERSFQAYLEFENEKEITFAKEGMVLLLKHIEDAVAFHKGRLEEYIAEGLNRFPQFDVQKKDTCLFHFQRVLGARPFPTYRNRLLIAVEKQELIEKINPFLTEASQEKILNATYLWLRLCILEDKLHRISFSKNLAALPLKEEAGTRDWSIRKYPEWLVFEVENGISIRKYQSDLAKYFLENDKAVVQLNVGKGKTRVIIPLLILHLTRNNDVLLRVVFLKQLMYEAMECFDRTLGCSVMAYQPFQFQFSREVDVANPKIMFKIENWIINAKKTKGGFLFTTPESILSLKLKATEADLNQKNNKEIQGNNCEKQLQNIANEEYFNILDESDQILHYSFQMAYTFGAPEMIAQLDSRLDIAEALSIIFQTYIKCEVSIDKLENNDFCKELSEKMFEKLLENPFQLKLSLSWFKKITDSNRSVVKDCILDTDKPFDATILNYVGKINGKQKEQLLSLRCFLGYGIFFHCLTMRNRIDHGIPRGDYARDKQLSVPFRANDVPSIGSEFVHPDVTILLTYRAYFDDGLTKEEMNKAFHALSRLGKTNQIKNFEEFKKQAMLDKITCPKEIDNVAKIDLNSSYGRELLYKTFKTNIKVIAFYLNKLIFKQQMQEYPKMICKSAWDLLHAQSNKIKCVGFSGTNDAWRLLPVQVTQHFPKQLQPVMECNGRMLSSVIDSMESWELLESEGTMWENTLKIICRREKAHALIDTGAFMKGKTNFQIAQWLIEHPHIAKFRGVVFYDKDQESWQVIDHDKEIISLQCSPIKEKDCFVYFDESHCRGADMKLSDDAHGVVTINESMKKNTFIQGVGRLRNLENGQTFSLIISKNVHSTVIQKFNELTIQNFLEWMISNSITHIVDAFPIWADNGFKYCRDLAESNYDVIDADLTNAYNSALMRQSIYEKSKKRFEPKTKYFNSTQKSMFDHVLDRLEKFGKDVYRIKEASVGVECERELEMNREEEEEIIKETPKCKANSEKPWSYDLAIKSFTVSELINRKCVEIMELSAVFEKYSQLVRELPWQKIGRNIFCTLNFVKTVLTQNLDGYYRELDHILFYPKDQTILCLSDYEANEILKYHSNDNSYVGGCILTSYAMFSGFDSATDLNEKITNVSYLFTPPDAISNTCKDDTLHDLLCCFQILNGDVEYSEQRYGMLEEILTSTKFCRIQLFETWVDLKDKWNMYDLSTMNKLINDITTSDSLILKNA